MQIRRWNAVRVGLALLMVALRFSAAFGQGYDRKDWPHWRDEDGDCQDARQEALLSWARSEIRWKTSKRCTVARSVWVCPYTGETFTDPSKLDADHVVPLKWAHSHGGHEWTKEKRRQFANDLANIIPVQAAANRSKGAKPPWRWLPPRTKYRCKYLQKWRSLVTRYELRMNKLERRSLHGYLSRYCAGGTPARRK